MKAPGGRGREKREEREGGWLQQRGSSISRNSEQNFPQSAQSRIAAVGMHLRDYEERE